MVYWCMMGAELILWRLCGAGRANGDYTGGGYLLMGAGANGGSIGVGMAIRLVEATSSP